MRSLEEAKARLAKLQKEQRRMERELAVPTWRRNWTIVAALVGIVLSLTAFKIARKVGESAIVRAEQAAFEADQSVQRMGEVELRTCAEAMQKAERDLASCRP